VAEHLDPPDPTAWLAAPGTRTWLILALVGAVLFVGPGPLAPTTTAHHRVTNRGPSARRTTIAASRVGIDEDYRPFYVGTQELSADFNAIKASGAAWVSFDFDWSTVQHEGPTSYNWAPLDWVVSAANARGLKVLAIPDYTPSWARGAGTDNKFPPTSNGDYINFVTAAVTRFAPQGVHTWAIWNEPNNPDFWKPNPDVAAYAELLKATYPEIKTLDPSAVVLTGGTAPASGSLSPASWLSGLYARGAKDSFDAVSHHPYAGLPYGPATVAPWNSFQQTLELRRLMVAHADGAKKIWGTEAGAFTGKAVGAVDRTTQARFIADYLRLWNKWSTFTGPLFIYELRDGGTNLADREDNWGLLTTNGTPKPAWHAFTAAVGR
jgi:hypothetical protein